MITKRHYNSSEIYKQLETGKNPRFVLPKSIHYIFVNTSLNKFEPFPKNSPISKMFREIGYADELGSRMRNTNTYTKLYSGEKPVFVEVNIFEILIPMSNVAELQVGPEKN